MEKNFFPIYIYNSRNDKAFFTTTERTRRAKTIFSFICTHDFPCLPPPPAQTVTSQETKRLHRQF